MRLDSNSPAGMGLMEALAKRTGARIRNGTLALPPGFGAGYFKSYDLGRLLKMTVCQYELKKDLTITRQGTDSGKDIITFSFRNLFQGRSYPVRLLPSVQVSSGTLDIEVHTPAGVKMNTILIIVHVDLLKDLFQQDKGSKMLEPILSGSCPCLYEEMASTGMLQVATTIFEDTGPAEIRAFHLKIKAEELIYLFFAELLKRQKAMPYPLNTSDVKAIYGVRDKVIADLSVPPHLGKLRALAGMSESKLNRLFKQIFGMSIYHYYQAIRINKAAFLIKDQKLSVSEAGHELGFTNLSHFTRIFEKHIGMKPKRYSMNAGNPVD